MGNLTRYNAPVYSSALESEKKTGALGGKAVEPGREADARRTMNFSRHVLWSDDPGHSYYELSHGAGEARSDMDEANLDEADLQGELERMHAASFGWALWCCGHRREDAEEVLQTAYLKVLDGRARFDGRSSLRTWFLGVVRRTAGEGYRRQWLRRQLFDRWLASEPSAPCAPDPERVASESESSRNLLRAVAGLAARQRQVLHLVFYQDLTVEEASRVMNISLGTARTHFDRGKRRLREILAEQEVHDVRR